MRKKMLWAGTIAVLIWAGFKIADEVEAKKRRELWAEATDTP